MTLIFIGSKDSVGIVSACSPGGSYTMVLRWLNDHSMEKIDFPQDTDVISFFDNNQVCYNKAISPLLEFIDSCYSIGGGVFV
jgi:hypothetical protein